MTKTIIANKFNFHIAILICASTLNWKLFDILVILSALFFFLTSSKAQITQSLKTISELKLMNLLIGIWVFSNIVGYFLYWDLTSERLGEVLGMRWILIFYYCIMLGANCNIQEKGIRRIATIVTLLISMTVAIEIANRGYIPRLEGFLRNANIFAFSVAYVWAFLLGWDFVTFKSTKRNDWIILGCIAVLTLFIILSQGRGTWLAVGLTYIATSILYKNKRNILVGVAAASGSLVIFFFNIFNIKNRVMSSFDFSAGNAQGVRLTLWQVNFEIFKDYPIFGIGFYENIRLLDKYYEMLNVINIENSSSVNYLNHAHNQIMQIMVGSGTVGTISFIALMGISFKYYKNIYVNSQDINIKRVALGATLTLAVFLLTGLVDAPLMVNESRNFLFLILGCTLGYMHTRKEHIPYCTTNEY